MDKPSWIDDDGQNNPEAHNDAYVKGKAPIKEQTDAVQAAMAKHPGKPMAPEGPRYVPHPDGSAYERWQRSGGSQSFEEWCIDNVPGRAR